jgi:hypothetical protein
MKQPLEYGVPCGPVMTADKSVICDSSTVTNTLDDRDNGSELANDVCSRNTDLIVRAVAICALAALK